VVVSTFYTHCEREREREIKSNGRTEKEKRAFCVKRSEGGECGMFESKTERESVKQQEMSLGL